MQRGHWHIGTPHIEAAKLTRCGIVAHGDVHGRIVIEPQRGCTRTQTKRVREITRDMKLKQREIK